MYGKQELNMNSKPLKLPVSDSLERIVGKGPVTCLCTLWKQHCYTIMVLSSTTLLQPSITTLLQPLTTLQSHSRGGQNPMLYPWELWIPSESSGALLVFVKTPDVLFKGVLEASEGFWSTQEHHIRFSHQSNSPLQGTVHWGEYCSQYPRTAKGPGLQLLPVEMVMNEDFHFRERPLSSERTHELQVELRKTSVWNLGDLLSVTVGNNNWGGQWCDPEAGSLRNRFSVEKVITIINLFGTGIIRTWIKSKVAQWIS